MLQRLASLALVAVCLGLPAHVLAGATSPSLVLSAASGEAADGARAVSVEGSFDFPNALQVGYPLQLVFFQGTRFARYEVAGAAVAGQSTALADGSLDEGELVGFLGDGAPAPAGVRIVTLTMTEGRVTLPAEFTAGPATAVLFTILADGSVISNPLSFVLP